MYLAPVGAAPVGVQPPVGVEMEGGAFQEGPEEADQARHAVPVPAPERPSTAEVEAHMTTHTPYARWCHDCVMGRGRDDRHEKAGNPQPDATPVIQLDYCFFEVRSGGSVDSRVVCGGQRLPPIGGHLV